MAGQLFCISAGQLVTKKADGRVTRRNLYLNYGLMSLASVLKRGGIDAVVIHGGWDTPEDTLRTAIGCGLADSDYPVLLSIPSFYALSWSKCFISLLKNLLPKLRVIVGGRWVVDGCPETLIRHLPRADMVVDGLAEHRIFAIVTGRSSFRQGEMPGQLSRLDYSLLYRRAEYQPSIEVSRGCGMGCSFCQEKDDRRSPLKSPADLVSELRDTLLRDQWGQMTPYFEASMFVPNQAWIDESTRQLESAGLRVKWRTEGRVDALNPDLIPALATMGLSVIDLGLESASPRQLLRMNKTKNPDVYLRRASTLLRACATHGIRVKLNILLSAGEDSESVDQTMEWMERHRNRIFGVSAAPMMVYGWPKQTAAFAKTLAQFGAEPCGSPCTGVTWLDLSDKMTYEKSLEVAEMITRNFMLDRHYYDLKSFSYFPRNYLLSDFERDLALDRNARSGRAPLARSDSPDRLQRTLPVDYLCGTATLELISDVGA